MHTPPSSSLDRNALAAQFLAGMMGDLNSPAFGTIGLSNERDRIRYAFKLADRFIQTVSSEIREPNNVSIDDIAAALWREEAVDSGTPQSIIDGRTRETFDDQADELKCRWRKFARVVSRLQSSARVTDGTVERLFEAVVPFLGPSVAYREVRASLAAALSPEPEAKATVSLALLDDMDTELSRMSSVTQPIKAEFVKRWFPAKMQPDTMVENPRGEWVSFQDFTTANDRAERAERNLLGRDKFIVENGLWEKFVSELPKPPLKAQS